MEKQVDLFQLERTTCNHIVWKEGQKELIADLYRQGESMRSIIKKFNGLHYNTIKKILKEYEIPLRTRAQSHYLDNRNENIFEQIDSADKAYWLGFLSADGCVHGNYVIITLQRKDKEHLEKFRNFIQGNSCKIIVKEKYCSYAIGCKKIAEDLRKHGVIERKSLTLEPPTTVPEEYVFDWIRGVWDGDGGISYSKKSNRWQMYFTGTRDVCDFLVEKLQINTKPFKEHRSGENNTWRIVWNGRLNCLRIANLMYKNNTATTYLDRKKSLYEQLLKTTTPQ